MIGFLLLVAACDADRDSTAPVDSGALDCAAEPVVTWDNFGEGLIVENCQTCHASTAVERHGAPDSVTFDTHEEVIAWKARILVVTNPDTRTMPPSLALDDDDQHLLEVWLACWE